MGGPNAQAAWVRRRSCGEVLIHDSVAPLAVGWEWLRRRNWWLEGVMLDGKQIRTTRADVEPPNRRDPERR